jgi:hypothetical protein
MPKPDPLAAALERLLAAAEARLPAYRDPDAEGEHVRFGLLSARFVADECRRALANLTPAGRVERP